MVPELLHCPEEEVPDGAWRIAPSALRYLFHLESFESRQADDLSILGAQLVD